jgi:ERCC4-type nuclease
MLPEPPITILVDSRESDSVVLPRLQHLGAHVKVGDLEAGSYVISGAIAVERISAAAFVEGVLNGRLYHTAGKMSLNFTRSVFMIEGDVHSTGLTIARDAIDGAIASLVCLEGASVLSMRNPSATADLIYRLAKKAQKGLGFEMAFQRAKITSGPEEALFSIESFAGIGPSTAPKALGRFFSVFAFVNASVQQLMTIPGIGQKKAERIFNSLRVEHRGVGQSAELRGSPPPESNRSE